MSNSCDCVPGKNYGIKSMYTQAVYKKHQDKVYSLEDLSSSSMSSIIPDEDKSLNGIFVMSEEQYEASEFPDEPNIVKCRSETEIDDGKIDSFTMPESFSLVDGFEKTNIVVKTE